MILGLVEKPPRLSEFELDIPQHLVAQHPASRRDESRLMVLNRKSKTWEHKTFKDFPSYFKKHDVIAMNNTLVYPARLYANKDKSGAEVEVFLLRELANNLWEAMVKPARKVRIGNKLLFGDGISCDVIDNTISGGRVIRFEYKIDSIHPFIDESGHSPLPPYIKRDPTPIDKERYQTVYAKERGSVAAPTAGLHFSEDILSELSNVGVNMAEVTLHIGLGTFRPIMVEDLTRHHMDSEEYDVSVETANKLNQARENKGRICAIGTSTIRTIESVTVSETQVTQKHGWTDKFIFPPYNFRMVDRVLTNFHQPKSTVMMMIAAFAGKDLLLDAYRDAIKEEYRFHSYGDAMFII